MFVNLELYVFSIFRFLGHDYRDDSLITVYLVVYESVFKRSDESDNFNTPKLVFKK